MQAWKSAVKELTLTAMMLFIGSNSSFSQSLSQEVSLFDGVSLSGWSALNAVDQQLWKVVDGVIVGGDGVQKVLSNAYLYTENKYEDFELRCLFRLTGDALSGMINSGIQYRSTIIEGQMQGYQADIGTGFWGDIYDEHRRGKLVAGDLSTLKLVLKEDGWNSYTIRVRGNHHEIFINGVKTSEYIEGDVEIPTRGIIAIQLHEGGTAKVEFRDLLIQEY